ncbi:MAG: STAS domain-containing protein [Bacilli bacterium]|nr:STAS domain-containing protein [Mollicutes bacterium]MDY6071354.1 STAS domain-containing protein [Bacilli bacterium]
MTTNIEFKKGILFVRLNGSFYNETLNVFESRVIPVILGMSLKRVNIDLKDVNFVDKSGIDSIIKISNVVSRYDGKVVISGINDKLKLTLKNSDLFDYCFKAKSEKHSIGIFSI